MTPNDDDVIKEIARIRAKSHAESNRLRFIILLCFAIIAFLPAATLVIYRWFTGYTP